MTYFFGPLCIVETTHVSNSHLFITIGVDRKMCFVLASQSHYFEGVSRPDTQATSMQVSAVCDSAEQYQTGVSRQINHLCSGQQCSRSCRWEVLHPVYSIRITAANKQLKTVYTAVKLWNELGRSNRQISSLIRHFRVVACVSGWENSKPDPAKVLQKKFNDFQTVRIYIYIYVYINIYIIYIFSRLFYQNYINNDEPTVAFIRMCSLFSVLELKFSWTSIVFSLITIAFSFWI